ncbi:MAG TPA: flagellar filament capping protein FliD [Steroidobacteraceae bacterium]|nr:flagellar filament capping protein FliD [Steroidobacteraceae bacterium]
MATNPVVSVASNSSAGAAGGSVIDVSALVSELVAATKAPQESLITSKTQAVTTEISAVGTLKSALSTFQSSLSPVATTTAFDSLSATSSDTTAFTASADSSATLGSYSVTVSGLAQAQQIVSTTSWSGGGSATVGTGTLQVSLGGTSFSVSIDSSNDTVSGIAAAINGASGNPGVEASVVTGTGGSAYLVLSSSLTGAANTIQVTETDGGSGLSALTYGTGNTANYSQQTAAKDASLSIAGISYTSASNTVTGALSGVTLNLLAPTTSAATLSVATNTAAVETNIQAFVAAYNALQGTFASLGSYNATTGTAGPMLGDALLSGMQSQVRSTLYSVVNTGSTTYNTLASIGVTTNSDGTLSVDTAKLSAALTADFSAVSQLFSGASGVASSLNSQITSDLASGGTIDSRSKTLVEQDNALTQQSNQLDQQMTQLTASLTQQYASLNTLLSSLQSTSSYLTQAFSNLPKVQATPAA